MTRAAEKIIAAIAAPFFLGAVPRFGAAQSEKRARCRALRGP